MSAKLNVDIVAQLKDFNKAMTELKSEVGDLNKQVNKGNQDGIKSTNALVALARQWAVCLPLICC
jgi:uncharacterized protein YlxW (UPF0749 family)